MSTFEEQILQRIADALGLTPEQLSTDYDSCFTPEEKAARNWWQKYDQLMRYYDAEARGRWNAALTNAVYFLYIAEEHPDFAVRKVCGYDPQKLLPHYPKNYDLWDRDVLAAFMAELPFTENVFTDFFPKAGKPTRYYIEGGHFDMYEPGEFGLDEAIYFDHPPIRHLAPFVTPRTGRISYPDLLPDLASHGDAVFTVDFKWPHKMAVIPIEKFDSPDFSLIELRALLASDSIRSVFIDIESRGGEIRGNPQLDLYAQGLALAKHLKPDEELDKKPVKDYLKHDPTKQHRRRKRK